MNLHGHPSWDACILITSRNPDNRRFGTGFIIYHSGQKSYVVTCAHVISDVGGEELIEADGQPARIVGIGSDDGLDLAVIEVDELLGKPVVKLKVLSIAGSPFLTVGFRAFGRHFSIAPLFGIAATAVALESRKYSDRVKAWNLEIRDGEHLHDGYSGSPVIDDDGFCLGVITYKQGDGQVGLAISIEELEKIWNTMPAGLIEKISEYQSYCDRLASQATRFYITGDLAQALDIYQQIRTIEPSYPRINMMIKSVEAEMGKPYIDRYGRVREDLIQSCKAREQAWPLPNKLAPRRSPILVSVFFYFLVLVLVVIVISIL
ncbi:serine protease [Microcystis aeruginosa EAWAG127a]|jgi:hypothetical protein|uniref:Serine protease n=1 Tax=Microcystis aeruginosa EAWAG127a TaxID=2529855 RepID=A0A5J5LZP7_MICAE|nr:serine protease [Microcystis aeruginosa]KAB0242921.1 serine protease [Microcystis aeruginosa EAWAG127a]